jgi:hypothetical protein
MDRPRAEVLMYTGSNPVPATRWFMCITEFTGEHFDGNGLKLGLIARKTTRVIRLLYFN